MNKLKTALVESFVGTLALGWIFAEAIEHFAGIFASPFRSWIMRKELFMGTRTAAGTRFSMAVGAPDLISTFVLLLIGYLLLRWLYFKPRENTAPATIET